MELKMKTSLTPIALAVATILSAGCASVGEKVEQNVEQAYVRAERLTKDVGHARPANPGAEAVVYEPSIWVANTTKKTKKEIVLPRKFYEPAFFAREMLSLQQFAERITARTGIPATVSPEAIQASFSSQMSQLQGVGSLPQVPGGQPVGTSGIPAMPSTVGMAGTQQMPQTVQISYTSGDLKGLLDTAVARYGVSWRYANERIEFFVVESRTFMVRAAPADASMTSRLSSGVSSGGSGSSGSAGGGNTISQSSGNSSMETSVRNSLNTWGSLTDSVRGMLSSRGRAVSSPVTNSITVTDTPEVLDNVAAFIDKQNDILSKQVVLNVTVLAVTTGDTDDYGISWNLVYQTLKTAYGITNVFNPLAGAVAISAAVLNSANSRWAGSQAVISALSQNRKVRIETTASVTALNNQPTPVDVSKQTTYIAQSSTTSTPNIGSTTAITPGVVSSGFSMTVLPTIMQDGQVILQFQTGISSLRQIRTITSGTSSIEAPELDSRTFLQRVAMKSGDTLVLSGFEQTDDNLERSGVGSADNSLAGGGTKGRTNKEVIVILVTPVVTM